MIIRPLIGLTGRRKRGADVAGFPTGFADVDLDVYVSDYARATTAAGGLPVHLPQHVDPGEYAGHLDGVLLSGGADVDPVRYAAAVDVATGPIEDGRDRAELGLIELAVEQDLPVLGICRGLQLLNVWAGGTLHQDVPAHARYDAALGDRVDTVDVEAGSQLGAMYGSTVRVNSLHHQTVDRVAAGWVVTARSADGTIEGLEWPGHDVIAVQWHPELLPGAATDPVFAWLVDRARAARRGALTDAPGAVVDDGVLLRAEQDVQARLDELGLAVEVDFASMAVVANVFRVASAAQAHLERTVLADAGLSFTAFTVMWVLWIWGETSAHELAVDAGVTKGTLSGVVGTLERRHLVVRRRDDGDGRVVRVATTAAGEATMAALFARFNAGERRIVSGLDAEQAAQLASLLRDVLRTVEEAAEPSARRRSEQLGCERSPSISGTSPRRSGRRRG